MPAIPPEQLVAAIANTIRDSGFTGTLASPLRRHPRRFIITGQSAPSSLSVYAWTLTFGGRPALANEYRIQMTSVSSPLPLSTDGPTILIGYERDLNLFAGFDLRRHRTFTTGSPSVQIDREALRRAETDGLSFHRKSNDEIAIGIRPDMFMAYATNASVLHQYGRDANILRLLNRAIQLQPLPPQEMEGLSQERRRVVVEMSRWSREAGFRQRVLFAYGNRCAVTRVQLRLVDAAHILPVGAPGSVDLVRNGIALSPTYHRAFDAGLIYLDDRNQMRINAGQLEVLRGLDLTGGLEAFRAPLGAIFLPPDPNQRPSVDFIRRANEFRQIEV
ncbi:MAG TPA: HNH endonuclease [Candidatus Acidoferrales bacterium]|jgi:putative restriction endonuclease|nr:HNH endonuclease [Candidatus Acidoferrales bacterium]